MAQVELENEVNEEKKTLKKTKRTSRERVNVSREAMEIFENDDWLAIPQSVKDDFEDQGFGLMWIRIMLRGQDDHQNIGRKQREGWEFVMADECPEMASGFRVMESGSLAGCIVRGDVALAKQPIEYGEARRIAIRKRTSQLEEAVNSRLRNDRPDRRAPVTDSSKSRVSTGRSARFDG